MKLKRTKRRRFWTTLAFVAVFLSTSAASAVTVYHHDLDPDHTLFGNLNQNDVATCKDGDGNSFTCGPTAAVNSFAFLQRKFPDIYDNSLIVDPGMDGIDYQDLIDTAEALGGDDYMMCTVCQGGTTIANFISGKRKWIEERVPGMTIYKDRQNPNWDFLFGELWDMEDVELLFGFYDGAGTRLGGHYVTLTKFWWEDTNMNGIVEAIENAMIGFVDPADGMLKMHRLAQTALGGVLQTDYALDMTQIATTRIDWAVSESPIPEPVTIVLFSLGVFGVVSFAQRRRTQ